MQIGTAMNAHTGFTSRIARWAFGSSQDDEGQDDAAPSSREASRKGSTREIDRRRALFNEIGDFLFAHDLDLTPVNFGLAYDYLTGADHKIASAVREILSNRGHLTNQVAEKLVAEQHGGDLTSDGLSKMLGNVEDSLKQISSLAKESTSSVSDYGQALQEQVAHMDRAATENPLIGTLVGLTRTMVERSRHIEVQMQESQKKTRALQKSLEVARKAAEQDHLTGLPNRRAFEARLKEEVTNAAEAGDSLCVAICDIDHFKNINDTHGHETGDRVLKFVASLLAKISDEKCHVARHGGEEFVMLFRGKDIEAAREIIDATREDLASRNLVDRNSGERMDRISFSAGVADVFGYSDPHHALKAADEALYLAKEHGRNRIYTAAPLADAA
jgi:diguanylate cyclase